MVELDPNQIRLDLHFELGRWAREDNEEGNAMERNGTQWNAAIVECNAMVREFSFRELSIGRQQLICAHAMQGTSELDPCSDTTRTAFESSGTSTCEYIHQCNI